MEGADYKSVLPGKSIPLWQRDYWDRFIRNEQHFLTAKHYIEQNPVKAGLVDSAEQWEWGSARLGDRLAEYNSAIPGGYR